MAIRILIGSGSETIIKQLKAFLMENGFEVIGGTTDGYELLRQVYRFYPDICICDFDLKGMNGHQVCQVLVSDRLAPVIVLVGASEVHHFSDIRHDSFFTYIDKPLNRTALLTSINLMGKFSKYIKKLEKEIKQLKKDMHKKELIQRAKGYLINHTGITEEEAHKKIITLSMNEGVAKEVIAERMIDLYEDED